MDGRTDGPLCTWVDVGYVVLWAIFPCSWPERGEKRKGRTCGKEGCPIVGRCAARLAGALSRPGKCAVRSATTRQAWEYLDQFLSQESEELVHHEIEAFSFVRVKICTC